MKNLILIFCLSMSTSLSAGVFELSLGTTFRDTNLDAENLQQARSTSASLAYYFWEGVAVQATYMQGFNYTKGRIDVSTVQEQVSNFTYQGLDLIWSVGGNKGIFKPFVKIGMAEIDKKQEYKESGESPIIATSNGTNLTGGIGFKYHLTQTLALKFSYDLWMGPIDADSPTTDTNFKLGISWFL
ncbi:MAG: outer membrane beta-barrel protein [Bdellovibrionales bacterium]